MTTPANPRRATVHVPIIPADGASVPAGIPLIRIAADDTPTPYGFAEYGLSPDMAGLHDVGLYVAATVARRAVAALGLQPARLWRRTWRSEDLTWPCLSVENYNNDKTSELQPETAHSAELGLALVQTLSLTHRASAVGTVVATGALGVPEESGGETAVLPVAFLETKLALILRELKSEKIHGPGTLFLPITTIDGRLVTEAHAEALAEIAEKGLAVRPVDGLEAAAAWLGARQLPLEPWQLWATRGAAAGLAAVIALVGALAVEEVTAQWADRPLPLEAAADPVSHLRTPLRALRLSDGRLMPLPPCRVGAEGREAVRVGEEFLLRVVPGGAAASEDVRGLHHALVLVSSSSGVKVFSQAMVDGDVGGAFGWAVPVREPAERGMAVVLTRRSAPFDGDAVGRGVRAAIADLRPSERLNAAAAHLRTLAPGYLAVPIEVLPTRDAACADG